MMKPLLDSLLKQQVKIVISTFLGTKIRIAMTFIAALCICGFQSISWKWGNHERSQL